MPGLHFCEATFFIFSQEAHLQPPKPNGHGCSYPPRRFPPSHSNLRENGDRRCTHGRLVLRHRGLPLAGEDDRICSLPPPPLLPHSAPPCCPEAGITFPLLGPPRPLGSSYGFL